MFQTSAPVFMRSGQRIGVCGATRDLRCVSCSPLQIVEIHSSPYRSLEYVIHSNAFGMCNFRSTHRRRTSSGSVILSDYVERIIESSKSNLGSMDRAMRYKRWRVCDSRPGPTTMSISVTPDMILRRTISGGVYDTMIDARIGNNSSSLARVDLGIHFKKNSPYNDSNKYVGVDGRESAAAVTPTHNV
ncbi:hypothetical protein C8R42DRAFT_720576 [Lentinula raphanica]|nr:hypothetical protein C8R42DRAFT_720576 [Lentinula raphanica]